MKEKWSDPNVTCHMCGKTDTCQDNGDLPEGWDEVKFLRGSYFVCPDDLHWPTCRVCGCWEHDPCEGGCFWIEEDLCSACDENSIELMKFG